MKRPLLLGGLLSFLAKAAFATTIFLTSGTTWVAPQDFSTSNTIEIIGAGARGNIRCGLPPQTIGGGGGAYAKVVGVALIPGATYNIHFGGESGANGSSGAADGVWFGTSGTVYAESGWDGGDCSNSGTGGRSSASVGSTKYSGGNGSLGLGAGAGVGAGGGAAGLNGAGGIPTDSGSDFVGGVGDNGSGGAGGTTAPGAGGNGTEWDGSHGSGGGGGANAGIGGAAGGLYGGGGGYNALGKGGLIVITYTPRNRVSSGVFD